LFICRKMSAADVPHASHAGCISDEDRHYLEKQQAYGDQGFALNDALDLFLERPELGFVWLAFTISVSPALASQLCNLNLDRRSGRKAGRCL